MTSRPLTLCAILLASLAWNRQTAAADLDDAIALYAEASYEAALEALNAADMQASDDLVDQYRALCFLALNRQLEAELSLERIVERSPLYRIDAAAVSPKIVDVFEQVRLRTLPRMARELYVAAKGQYDRAEFPEARLGFLRLGEVVQEASAIGAGDNLQDLVQLGEGFLVLIEAKLAPPPAPEPEPTDLVEAVPDPEVPEEGRIYSSTDTNVVPPVPIERDVPPWVPPDGALAQTTIHGAVEFVVDENGTVVQAAIAQPMWLPFDRSLLAATRDWRFRPATLGGTPVKFQQRLSISLEPPER
jgi:TonB family protein